MNAGVQITITNKRQNLLVLETGL